MPQVIILSRLARIPKLLLRWTLAPTTRFLRLHGISVFAASLDVLWFERAVGSRTIRGGAFHTRWSLYSSASIFVVHFPVAHFNDIFTIGSLRSSSRPYPCNTHRCNPNRSTRRDRGRSTRLDLWADFNTPKDDDGLRLSSLHHSRLRSCARYAGGADLAGTIGSLGVARNASRRRDDGMFTCLFSPRSTIPNARLVLADASNG